MNVTVQWRLRPGVNLTSLYNDYREFSAIQINVVDRQLQSALNTVYETFDPLATISGDGTQLIQQSDLAAKALPILQAAMPAGVEVLNLTLPNIVYGQTTQDNIDKIISATAATRSAEQQEKTATAIAAAAAILANSPLTPAVLYQQCLNMVEREANAGHVMNVGFSCGNPLALTIPAQ